MNPLLKVTELVDKDVAENSKPLSLIAVVIPWLPFMFFVDGAPADTHPVLSGLALAASAGWLLFVLSRVFRHTKRELAPHRKSLGAARFWMLMAGTVLAILLIAAIFMWLEG